MWQGPSGRAARHLDVRLEEAAARPPIAVPVPAVPGPEARKPEPAVVKPAPMKPAGEERQATLPAPVEVYYSSREVDERAIPLNQVDLDYPEEAYRQHLSGTVKLRILIDSRGDVREVTVIDAEPKGVFDEAALRAIRATRFQPALRKGLPVGSIKNIEVPFFPNCNRTGSCPK